MTPAPEARKPDRLSLPHWQALLEAGLGDAARLGLPEPAAAYLQACLLHGDAAQWQAYGNGWSLKTGDAWRKRAKDFVPAQADAALRDAHRLQAARFLAQAEAREPGAPLSWPRAAERLGAWAGDYSRFGLLCAGNGLLTEFTGALQAWLSAALASKPWPAPAALQEMAAVTAAHARWLGSHPLTAQCFPFGSVVQLLGKAGAALPAEATLDCAAALEQLVFTESTERRRRDQWVAQLRALTPLQ